MAIALLALVLLAVQPSWTERLPSLVAQIGGGYPAVMVGAGVALAGLVAAFVGRKSRRRWAAGVGSLLSVVAFVGLAQAGFAIPYFTYVRGVAWSPDGTRIAYGHSEGGTWVVPADGSSEPTRLVALGGRAVWSPDGTRIAYRPFGVDEAGKWGDETGIWVVSADGSSEPSQLVVDGDSPAWSPDGTTIAYTARVAPREEQRNEVWLVDADGGNPRRLTYLQATQIADVRTPAWSPDGTQIAFVGVPSSEGASSIWRVAADGGNLAQVITEGSGPAGSLAWSPDGRQIAYAGEGGTILPVWVVNVDGTGGTKLPSDAHGDPQWTSGGRIAVDCQEGMVLMNPDGTDRQVAVAADEGKSLAVESARVLSPDGTRVVYATGAGWATEIVVHTIDGSTQITVDPLPGDKAVGPLPNR